MFGLGKVRHVSASDLMQIGKNIGTNCVVVALSVARPGAGLGNSIVFILIPLYVPNCPPPCSAWPSP